MLRLAFLGIDHPHGAHWREQLANFTGEAEIVAFVPSFGGGTASLEERYAHLPRFDSDVARRAADHYLFDPAASGSGFFSWLACHWLDTLLYVTGQSIVGVTARTGVFGAVETKVEDGGVAILDLANGGIATFLGGYW